jgi:hypothetical protein
MKKKERLRAAFLALISISLVSALLVRAASRAPAPSFSQETDVSGAPGPLSASHAVKPGIKDCAACHTPEGDVLPGKCLACHQEIAVRIKEGRVFHKDKGESCGACHAEHRGPDAGLLPLDPKDFDHSETGTVLAGAHARVAGCDRCHYSGAAFPRATGKSYLLRDASCSACHVSPHPGDQDECLACHGLESWRVDGDPAMK